MNGAVVNIDQGDQQLQSQVVNLDDLSQTILKKHHQSSQCQTPTFDDMNEHVTPDQTLKQTFDVVSPRTKACNCLLLRQTKQENYK